MVLVLVKNNLGLERVQLNDFECTLNTVFMTISAILEVFESTKDLTSH